MPRLIAALFCLVSAASLRAQTASPPFAGWTLGFGAILIRWSGSTHFEQLGGPALQVSRVGPRRVGFDFRVAYIPSTGFYNLRALSGILGLNYGMPAGAHLLQLKGGATAILGGDSDGSVLGAGGPYLGGGALLRLGDRTGIQLDGLVRFYTTGDGGMVAPSAGLMIVRRLGLGGGVAVLHLSADRRRRLPPRHRLRDRR